MAIAFGVPAGVVSLYQAWKYYDKRIAPAAHVAQLDRKLSQTPRALPRVIET
jgi:hypothetical protein